LVNLASLVLPIHLSIPMNSISVSIHLQKEPVVCPQCGSTARLAHDLCLRCMLLLGIGACGDTSETLDYLLSEIDVQ
jgi:predicted amidophosphoribosyltransferase